MAHRPGLSYRFTHAITRTPSDSVSNGIRAIDSGDPDAAKFRAEHGLYVKALQEAGLRVDVLPALEEYPDSCFVEDPAFCLPEGAIRLRPGTASREGEGTAIRPALENRFGSVVDLPGSGCVDGGDVLMLDDIILIGLSARTDRDGADAFCACSFGLGLSGEGLRDAPGCAAFQNRVFNTWRRRHPGDEGDGGKRVLRGPENGGRGGWRGLCRQRDPL